INAAGKWRAGLRALFRTILIGGVFVLCSPLAQYLLGYDLLATVRAASERDHSSFGLTGFDSLRVWYQISAANLLAVLIGSGVMIAALWGMALGVSFVRRHPIDRFTWTIGLSLVLLCISTLFTLE